ncbi:MAG: efflux RND transporter periplasmic adaptor subunit [Pseudomonadota bacterium]
MLGFCRLAAVAAIAILMTACGGSEPPPAAPKVRPAKLVSVQSASQQRDLSFPAVVRAVRSAELTFQVAGEVIELNALEGQDVKAGDVIARLDQRDARNNLAQAQAEYNNALSEYRRAERLVEQDAISQSILESRKTQLDVREASVATAQKALEDTEIRAPFDGGISRVYIEQFQNIQAKEAIAVVQSTETEALVDIPGTIIARIPQLEPVGTRVILDAAPDVEIPAVFREASGVADSSTQTYQISFTFEPPEQLYILPGMTATVLTTFVFKEAQDIVAKGIAVPLSAVLAEGEKRYVYVVDDAMRISKREVTIGPDIANTATVTTGLNGDETIVAAGVSFLNEGMTVSEWVPE